MAKSQKDERLIVRATKEQLQSFQQAAEAQGLSLSAWVRFVLLKATKENP